MGTVKYHMNDVIEKHQNRPKDPVETVKKKEALIVLPFLGYHSKHLTNVCNQSLSLGATIMVSKNCPAIGEHAVIIFVTQ